MNNNGFLNLITKTWFLNYKMYIYNFNYNYLTIAKLKMKDDIDIKTVC